MLLSVSLLMETGRLKDNRIMLDSHLADVFRSLFAIARRDSDKPTAHNPFFHLAGEGFWHLHPNPGMEEAVKHVRQVKGSSELRTLIAYASLDEELFHRLHDPSFRQAWQAELIQTYLSHVATPMWRAVQEEVLIATRQQELMEKAPPRQERPVDRVRSAAFRRLVRELYDVRCAACGVRFFFEEVDLIDAAHLIPFSESGDDRPQNGIALCKNHHWLMDHAILAPGPGRGKNYQRPIWHVCSELDNRLEEHRTVLELKGRAVLIPQEHRYAPSKEGLDWRMEQLKRGSTEAELDYTE
jgi:putative restriction endonuclease